MSSPKAPSPEEQPGFLQAKGLADLAYPNEPQGRFSKVDFDGLLIWCSENSVSDIHLMTNDKVVVELSGRMKRVTRREFSNTEVGDILSGIYGSDSILGELNRGQDRDFAYDLKPDRTRRYRFRVNATSILSRGQNGIQVTLRTISSKPIDLKLLNLEEEIFRAMAPAQGMVVVTGSTGSGKSTLLSSIMRYRLEQPDANLKLITYESPIEYVYDELDMPSSLACQSEVPRNLPTFSAGTRNSLRRAPKVILVGESRDAETMGEAIVASMTGHALYTTVHSNDVASTIRRMVSVFPEGERNARAADLITSLRLIVSQRLEKSPDGRRVALREFLVITPEIQEVLLSSKFDELSLTTKRLLDAHGQSFLKDAQKKFAEGRLSLEQLRAEEARDSASRRDAARQAKLGEGHAVGQGLTGAEESVEATGGEQLPAPAQESSEASRRPAGVVEVKTEPSETEEDRLTRLDRMAQDL